MPEVAHSIDLNLSQKLREDPAYRQRFFWAEASAEIAAQLIALRKRRQLSQKQVAELTGTKQPAISRAEQADYQNWNINTFRSIAGPLDARVRVLIQPSEDVLHEYEEDEERNLPLRSFRNEAVAYTQPITWSNNAFLQSRTLLGLQASWATSTTQVIGAPYTGYAMRDTSEIGFVVNSAGGTATSNIVTGVTAGDYVKIDVNGTPITIAATKHQSSVNTLLMASGG